MRKPLAAMAAFLTLASGASAGTLPTWLGMPYTASHPKGAKVVLDRYTKLFTADTTVGEECTRRQDGQVVLGEDEYGRPHLLVCICTKVIYDGRCFWWRW